MTTRTRLHELLVVAGLTGFAFSQPLLSVLGENPTVFTRGRVVGTSLVVFVVVLALLPPLLLWFVGAVTSAVSRHAGNAVHLLTVGGLVGVTVVQLLKQQLDIDETMPLALAAIGGALLFVAAYDRFAALSLWSRFTAPLPLLAMALFLLTSPAGALARERAAIDDATAVERSGPPVVFVLLDEFPTRSLLDADGGLDVVRFPRLAEFAEDATWYRHHTSVAPFTSAAVPTILTGKLPTESPAEDHPDNLFTLLAPSHELVVSEAATSLCVFEECRDPAPAPEDAGIGGVLGTAFDVWERRVSLTSDDVDPLAEFTEQIVPASPAPMPGAGTEESVADVFDGALARGTPARLAGLIDSFDSARPSTLWYQHVMLPHQPWVTWPDGATYRETDVLHASLPDADRLFPFSWSEPHAMVSEQRHLLQAQNTDRLIGEVLDALRAEGLYDDALIVFTGDHGLSFESRTGARVATEPTLDSIAYTPLFMKTPGQTDGGIDDSNLMSVDVLPTVAAAVGVDVPWPVDGYVAGSPEIAARGTTKDFYLFTDVYATELSAVVEFDDATTFPSVDDRWIGPLVAGASPASELWEALGVTDAIGRDVESFEPVDGGVASIQDLDDVLEPPDDRPPIGIVQGAIEDGPDQGRVLLAVDGRVASGTLLAVDSRGVARFSLLVEPGTITTGSDVDLLVQDAGVTARVTLRD